MCIAIQNKPQYMSRFVAQSITEGWTELPSLSQLPPLPGEKENEEKMITEMLK